MNVTMNYDYSFNDQFGADVNNVIRRVAAHAENLYRHPTLINPISWVISGSGSVKVTTINPAGNTEFGQGVEKTIYCGGSSGSLTVTPTKIGGGVVL